MGYRVEVLELRGGVCFVTCVQNIYLLDISAILVAYLPSSWGNSCEYKGILLQ